MEKLLVIEDSPLVQLLLNEIFRAEYELEFQNNGLDGLTAAQSGHPDLILLDIHLPEMDGYEVCRILKRDDTTRRVPIIFITSLDSEAEKVRGFEAGADDYVVKPFYPRELRARVKAHLALHKAKKQALRLERLTVFKEMAVAISHEFNNSLTAVYAYLHLLEAEMVDASVLAQESLEGINHEFRRLREITNRLTNASNAENTKYNDEINMIDLQKIQIARDSNVDDAD